MGQKCGTLHALQPNRWVSSKHHVEMLTHIKDKTSRERARCWPLVDMHSSMKQQKSSTVDPSKWGKSKGCPGQTIVRSKSIWNGCASISRLQDIVYLLQKLSRAYKKHACFFSLRWPQLGRLQPDSIFFAFFLLWILNYSQSKRKI